MIWQPGDMALLVHFPGDHLLEKIEWIIGEQCTLIAPLMFVRNERYDWKIEVGNETFMVSERHLKPIPPPREKGSWDDCIWQPKEIEHDYT